jgi:hypothetical protein
VHLRLHFRPNNSSSLITCSPVSSVSNEHLTETSIFVCLSVCSVFPHTQVSPMTKGHCWRTQYESRSVLEYTVTKMLTEVIVWIIVATMWTCVIVISRCCNNWNRDLCWSTILLTIWSEIIVGSYCCRNDFISHYLNKGLRHHCFHW